MTRLIDADALLKAVVDFPYGYRGMIESEIENQPTVDAEPIRHGKWIDDGQYDNFFPHHEWRCSECGEHVLEIGLPWFKFCPACGARMDAERKEE